MKIFAGIVVGVTLTILAHVLGWPLLGWMLTRIPPATHPDCRPFIRRYEHGVLVEDCTIGG